MILSFSEKIRVDLFGKKTLKMVLLGKRKRDNEREDIWME